MTKQGTGKTERIDELAEYISKVMPHIDARLEHTDVSLRERQLFAATFFVDEMVVEVSVGGRSESTTNTTDYVTTPWFAVIYHHVEKWYRERYGEALDSNESGRAIGYVLVRSLPVELIVPLTRSRIEKPGESAWLSFPKEVEADEDPLQWLGTSPNIASLDDSDKNALIKATSEIATSLRAIRTNSMGIEPPDDTASALLDGIIGEFESAAHKALRGEPRGRLAALWNIHLAIERSLKAFSQHKTGTFRETHNLFLLYDDVASHGIVTDRNTLKKFRRESDVIDNRYSLGRLPTVAEVFVSYEAGLRFASDVVKSFRRKMNIGGASFLLAKPPWTSLPPTQDRASD